MKPLRRILIVGGGSSGWMTAALFSKLFQGLYDITLVESDDIGIIGVGEATIPAIKKYNELLELDENDFLRRTQGTFKLGIRFENWGAKGDAYFHGFGPIGKDWDWLRCHQYWLKAREMGRAENFDSFAINTVAAYENKFLRAQPEMDESPLGQIGHAFHFDAGLYARYLSAFAQDRGVRRHEGKIVDVTLRGEDGFIESVTLESGEKLEADLFIDCSGFRSLLLGGALKTPFVDWSQWLLTDSALAMPCARSESFTPYTRSRAHGSGWQWRIPLQHRTGNGHVYSSKFISDDEAEKILRENLDGEALADPLQVRFTPGKREKLWNKNCVAIGLAGGFLEPLESTALHLVQAGIIRLIRLFPDLDFEPAPIAEFNKQTDFEFERIRDFIILHYKATTRDDTPFWDYCRTMDVPDTLKEKIDLWMSSGRVFRENDELFGEESWIQVFIGQRMIPHNYDPQVNMRSDADLIRYLANITTTIKKCVAVMPTHAEFIEKTCAAQA